MNPATLRSGVCYIHIVICRGGFCRLLLRNLFGALCIISVADPDPESGVFFWPLDPGSGTGKNPDPGSGMNIPDLNFEKLITVFGLKILLHVRFELFC
jgi:hypothetical protein